MFRRRRRPADLIVFDLDAGDGSVTPVAGLASGEAGDRTSDADGTGAADGTGDEPSTPPERPGRHRTRAQSVRQLVAAGTVLVVGLTAWAVTATVREDRRVARLVAAPGGVRDLSRQPAELWSVETDDGWQVLFLPGLVVDRERTELVARDADTGSERWRAEVGGDPQCQAATWWGGGSGTSLLDRIVCWSGPNAPRSVVTVVDPDGTTTTREVTGDPDAVAPAAGGGLVVASRTGPVPPPPDVSLDQGENGGFSVEGQITQGRDVLVRFEDAATGDLRWQQTVPFDPPSEPWSCAWMTQDENGQEVVEVDVDQLWAVTHPEIVLVQGCGITQVFTPAGVRVGASDLSAWSDVQPYADGGVLEQVGGYSDDGVTTVLRGRDGGVVGTFGTPLLNPWATDGTAQDVRLVGGIGEALARVDDDGGRVWETQQTVTDLLVRAGGVAVVARDSGALAGIDLGSGDELWAEEGPDLIGIGQSVGWYSALGMVRGAYTDGTTGMLVVDPELDGSVRLVAFDLATGTPRWETRLPATDARPMAVEGRLFVVSGGSSSTYTDEDGLPLRTSAGTVTALG